MNHVIITAKISLNMIGFCMAKPKINSGKCFIIVLYDKFYGLDVFREGGNNRTSRFIHNFYP